MSRDSKETQESVKPLSIESRQHRAIQKKNESMASGIIKGLIYLLLTAVVYFGIFYNSEQVLALLTTKTYSAPLISMTLVVLVAYLLGTGINKIIKHTLERALESQNLREE